MERFGRYVLLEKVASGGMASVYRALMLGSGGFSKHVAVKRVLPSLADDPTVISSLVEEAKIASSLAHPNVVPILDLGTHDGQHFIAMEFVSGQSLGNVIVRAHQRGLRLPLEFCVHAAQEALKGLSYAHRRKSSTGQPMDIVHRDVSPQNIMVSYDGRIMLVDFGIARAAERTSHTQTGVLKGKPGYLSPEVVSGAKVTQQVDVFAMGVVLHEMIAMRRLYGAFSDLQILGRVMRSDFEKFDVLGIEVPAALSDAVYRALDADPAARWPDAQSFASHLDELSRTLDLHWDADHVAALMTDLFPGEIKAEEMALARSHAVAASLHEAEPDEISGLLKGHAQGAAKKEAPPAQSATPTALVARRRPVQAPTPVIFKVVVGAALVLSAASVAVLVANRPVASSPSVPPQVAAQVPDPAPPVPTPPPASSSSGETADPAPEDAPPVTEPGPRTSPRKSRRTGANEEGTARGGRMGTLTLQSKPWAKVTLDGKDMGFTPMLERPVPAGRHSVTLTNSDLGLSRTFTVNVKAGETTTVSRELK